jgi:hypothetical protein
MQEASMRTLVRMLSVILLIAIAFLINVSTSSAAQLDIDNTSLTPYPAQSDNVSASEGTENATVEGGGTSFFSIFPTWAWWAIGGTAGVLIIMIIILVAVPSRKKGGVKPMKGMPPGGMQPMSGTGAPGQGPGPTPTPMGGPGAFNQPMGTGMPPQAPGAFPMQEQYQMPGQFPGAGTMAPPYQQYTRRPIFSINNLTITPNQVKAGNPVTISAIVSNNGSDAGTYSVVLRINGMVENIMDLMLSPGATQTTTFLVTKEIGGEYYAEVDGLNGIFIVIPLVPANFTISNLVIVPERAKQGESILISAMVTNNGELAGTYNATLKLKGAVENTEEISLSPGENRKVTFKIAKTSPGFYNVELDGLSGRFVIEMEWQT